MQRWSPAKWRLWAAAAALAVGLLLAQRPPGGGFTYVPEYVPPPPDAGEETEFYFTRLAYRAETNTRWGEWSWMIDSPKAERHFIQGLRRMTNLHARSMEKHFQATDAELFDHPWLYVVEPGQWFLSDQEAVALREYLLRGGFLMTDDFHGSYEWHVFTQGMQKVFPDRPIVEIEDRDAIFHVLFDLDERFQVPGLQYLYSGRIAEMDGIEPHWRGIYDDQGRLMVAINFNMDLGDAWEHADFPPYPERYTALAYRIGINYIIYALTH